MLRKNAFNTMSCLFPGLVLPAAARDAGALYQHIPSLDVLQAADVAASRRSGSRTRGGRDLRPGGVATAPWVVTEPEFRRRQQRGGCGAALKTTGNDFRERFARSRASRGLRAAELGTDAKRRFEGTRREDRGRFCQLDRGRSRITNDRWAIAVHREHVGQNPRGSEIQVYPEMKRFKRRKKKETRATRRGRRFSTGLYI